ncbi:MAG: glycosyltransferase family 4 protein [Bacteroidaceae bacterium]|nr:glycosyltransferase family 4 protein [Bacteroidaceae bacterium]
MKILINTPYLTLPGGVANHYKGLEPYWSHKVYYNQIGKRSEKSGNGIFWLPIDVFKFVFKLIFINPDFVLLNPSLGKSAIKRDFIFLNIARFLGKEIAVFFHGFNIDNIKEFNIKSLKSNINKCKCVFILAQEFADIVKSWGVTVPIHLTTTKVDDRLIEGFDINTKNYSTKNILFLARIEKAKGIYTALDAIKILQKKDKNIKLRIAGIGGELENAKQYAIDNNIDADFLGNISGEKLINEFKAANVYILPTHGEGMPTSVLEAMAFGLPVISRPVGGLCDFFIDEEMGYLISSLNPEDYAKAIKKYIDNPTKTEETANYNHNFAKEHFLASSVAKSIEEKLFMHIYD